MTRRKWLWTALLATPLAVAGVVYGSQAVRSSYVCPITGEELPCPKCCPLHQSKQQTNQQAQEQSYTCPVTGEELPCRLCCPLNESKQQK
jgi:hypothetical protein